MRPIAPNIVWMWAPNANLSQTIPLGQYWPGARFVDLVGLDGYPATPGDTFASTFASSVASIRSFTHLQIIIAETGINKDWPRGAEQLAALTLAARAQRIKALIYFDYGDYALSAAERTALIRSMGK
jgi:beta-mannanase